VADEITLEQDIDEVLGLMPTAEGDVLSSPTELSALEPEDEPEDEDDEDDGEDDGGDA
jgi:hypothetical protein